EDHDDDTGQALDLGGAAPAAAQADDARARLHPRRVRRRVVFRLAGDDDNRVRAARGRRRSARPRVRSPLNSTGRARADLLARFLEYLDVVGGVNAIYAAPYRRAEQTAAPLANRLGLMVRPAVFEDTEAFMEQILDEHKGEIVLFVVDREAIAPMIEELHGSKRVPEIAPDEYENRYVVTVPWGGGAKVKTLRMLYGLDWRPPEETRTTRESEAALELR